LVAVADGTTNGQSVAIPSYCCCAALVHPASNTAIGATLIARLAVVMNVRMRHPRFAPAEAARLPQDCAIIAEIL
jgi:hypothetical protein